MHGLGHGQGQLAAGMAEGAGLSEVSMRYCRGQQQGNDLSPGMHLEEAKGHLALLDQRYEG